VPPNPKSTSNSKSACEKNVTPVAGLAVGPGDGTTRGDELSDDDVTGAGAELLEPAGSVAAAAPASKVVPPRSAVPLAADSCKRRRRERGTSRATSGPAVDSRGVAVIT
jgi:hypothetical protein